jgi:hypothetical protein
MSRNVVAQGTPSFAGLMDHLTGFSRDNVPDAGTDFGVTFRRNATGDAAPDDTSLTNPRNGARAMLPVTERKPGRGAAAQDASAMSYERALRIHARHRKAPAPQPPAEQRASSSEREATAGKSAVNAGPAPPKVTPSGWQSGKRAAEALKTAKESATGQAQSSGGARSPSKAPVSADVSGVPVRIPAHVSTRTPAPVPAMRSDASPARQRKATVSGASNASSPREPASVTKAEKTPGGRAPAKARRKTGAGEKSAPLASRAETVPRIQPDRTAGRADLRETLRAQNEGRRANVDLASNELSRSQLELLPPLSQLDQRRTIVSVRLTEDEFACLRDRAEESGISVSAYMRSCVVDAEQLRAQVKRALAEMRQSSAGAGPGNATALAARSERSGGVRNHYGWIKLAMRPLTFLFGPLFPSRAAPEPTAAGRSGQ